MTGVPDAAAPDAVGRVRALVALLVDPVPGLVRALAAAEAVVDREPRLGILEVDPFAVVDPTTRTDGGAPAGPGRGRRPPPPLPAPPPGAAVGDLAASRVGGGRREGAVAGGRRVAPPAAAGDAVAGRRAATAGRVTSGVDAVAAVIGTPSPRSGAAVARRDGLRAGGDAGDERAVATRADDGRTVDFASLAGPRLDALLGSPGRRTTAGTPSGARPRGTGATGAVAPAPRADTASATPAPAALRTGPDGGSTTRRRATAGELPAAAEPAAGGGVGEIAGPVASGTAGETRAPRFALRRGAGPAVHGTGASPVSRQGRRPDDLARPAVDLTRDGVGRVDAEALVDLVAAVLAEQARRHGVDLS